MKRIGLTLFLVLGMMMLFMPPNTSVAKIIEPPPKKESETEPSGMPGRPIPAHPVPHHEPGETARLANVQNTRSASGTETTLASQDIQALLADGTLSDPLAGNYDIVYLDQLVIAKSLNATTSKEVEIETWNAFAEPDTLITPALIAGSNAKVGDTPVWAPPAVATGDLNGDNTAEQIAAWRDYDTAQAYLSIGGIPGTEGRLSSDPAAVIHDDGSLDLLARGPDYALWHRHYNGSAWDEWNSNGGYLKSAPAVARLDGGQFYVFAAGVYNDDSTAIYWRRWDGTAWATDWALIDVHLSDGTELVGDPAVVAWGPDRIDLFCRASDNTLRWSSYEVGGGWGAWQDLGGFIIASPTAVSWSENHVQVFAEGVDGTLWHITRDGNDWHRWQRLTGLAMTSKIAAISPITDELDIYVRGEDYALWSNHLESGSWGEWQPIAGVLDSGAAAVFRNGKIDVFAQTADDPDTPQKEEAGYVQQNNYVSDAWTGWQNQGGLENCCVQYNTGVGASRIALETGHFTGDGREQIVLAYSNGSNYGVRLYDIEDGLRPVLLDDHTWNDAAIDGSNIGYFTIDVSTGDLDGDGRDEIGLVVSGKHTADMDWNTATYVLSVVNTDPWTLEEKWNDGKPSDVWNTHAAFVTASGDLDGNGDDELVTAWTRCGDWWSLGVQHLNCDTKITVYNYESGWNINETASHYFGLADYDPIPLSGGGSGAPPLNLAIADLDMNPELPGDEIIFAGVSDTAAWEGEFSLWQVNPLTSTNRIWVERFPRESYAAKLTVGDFNRDLRPEVAFAYHIDTGANPFHLGLYGYKEDSFEELVSHEMTSTVWSKEGYFTLATGAVTGESLRIGPPTYRREKSANNIVAILNTPPTHNDVLSGTEYTVGGDAYSIYEKGQQINDTFSHSFLHNWSLSIGGSMGVGDSRGTHFKASFDATYGGHFEAINITSQSVEWTQSVQASNDDVLLFSYSDYDVWEYPVYADGDRIPDDYLAVIFPVAGSSGIHTSPGNACQSWYAPTHEVGNLWSYPVEESAFNGYDPADDASHLYVGSITTGGAEYDWTHLMSTHTSEKLSHRQSLGVMAGLEIQIGGDETTVKGGLVFVEGETKTRTPFFKGYVNGSYDFRYLFESDSSITEQTTVKTHIGQVEADSSYSSQGHLFWAEEGYLKLDYTANPEPHAFWNLYTKADPAFIRPWADGHCDDPLTDRTNFSRDIIIWPSYINRGETVIISATVRNYSNVTANNVKVRFYLGDPEDGGQQIGTDQTIVTLARTVGPETVSTQWTATGSGVQRIYAVIDPENELEEMHDEVSNVNNNQGYNLVKIGKASYLDPAMSELNPYYRLSYTLDAGTHLATRALLTPTQTVSFDAYIPLENLDAIILFSFASLADEDIPVLPTGMVTIGDVVALEASQAGIPVGNLDLTPTEGSPPGVIAVAYNDTVLQNMPEQDLRLYTWTGTMWTEPTCAGRVPLHLTEDNMFIAPVCETGIFALFRESQRIYLPLVTRQ